MMPMLYTADETAFDTNGIGILSDAIDCTVTEILNNSFELEMKYPVRGIHYTNIQRRAIIKAKPNPVTAPQPFRIYRITKPMSGVVTIYARHKAYDLMGITAVPFSVSDVQSAVQALQDNAVSDCQFTFSTDQSISKTMDVKVPKDIWTIMGTDEGCILDVYGGEYQFDGDEVELLGRRGEDRGVSIRYGKNLTSVEQDENCANCYTALHPYWTDGEGQLVQLSEKFILANGNHGYIRIMPLDLSREFNSAPTESQLREVAQKYIDENNVGVPTVSWKIQFAQLEQTEEYRGKALLERVLLGDTVTVQYAELGISATARAVEVRYKPILERYDSVTLGDVKNNLADTIVSQNKQIASKPNQTQMQLAIQALTSAILGVHGGAVRFLDTNGDGIPDTLYIADNPDPELAVKVWRFNYEGWGASKTGYNGPFTLGASFDTGILAEFVTAGTLYGMLLKAGIIESESGGIRIDLTSDREPVFNTGISTNGLRVRGDAAGTSKLFTVEAENHNGTYSTKVSAYSSTGKVMMLFSENFMDSDGDLIGYGCQLTINDEEAKQLVDFSVNDALSEVVLRGNDTDSGPKVRLYRTDDMASVQLFMDGTVMGALNVDSNGVSLNIPGRTSKYLSWQPNSDGTFTLTGKDS